MRLKNNINDTNDSGRKEKLNKYKRDIRDASTVDELTDKQSRKEIKRRMRW